MKRTLPIFIFLFVLVSLNIYAQNYQPMPVMGGQWDVARCWSFYPGGWHDEYSIQLDGADTIINGRTYKKLNLCPIICLVPSLIPFLQLTWEP